MSINEPHELPAQVFGGVGRQDELKEVGSKSRWVELDYITCRIKKGGGKEKLDHGHKYSNFSGTGDVDVVEVLSG